MTASQQVARVTTRGGFGLLPGHRVFDVLGRDGRELLGRLSTNELGPLSEGAAVFTAFLTPKGRVRHRALLRQFGESLILLAEPGTDEALPAWIEEYTFVEDCQVRLRAGESAALLCGPGAGPGAELEARLAGIDGEGMEFRVLDASFGCLPASYLCGAPAALAAAREQLVGEGRVELDAEELLQLRVEAGHSMEGHELGEDYHALEAGLGPMLSFSKGCYTGQEVVARQDSRNKVLRTLVGLVFDGRPEEREELTSCARSGCRVTTVAPSAPEGLPTGHPAGPACLGYVRSEQAADGVEVIGASGLRGLVVELPYPAFR